MWVGTLIKQYNSVESDIFYLIYPSKQKVLFESVKKINEFFKRDLEIPMQSIQYMYEDDEKYFVYFDGKKENNLEEVIEEISYRISRVNESLGFNFSLDILKPYFLELSYNENYITEGYYKKVLVANEERLKDIENICLYFLSEIHYSLKDQKEFNTIEKCIKFLENYKSSEGDTCGIDLNIKIKQYDNSLFNLLKEYRIEGENVKTTSNR